MFTRNWYKAMSTEISRVNDTFQSVTGTTQTLSVSAYLFNIMLNEDNRYTPSIYKVRTALDSGGGVIFGTGNAIPTIDDTALSGDLVSGFSYNSHVSAKRDADGVTITALYTVINNNAEAITISEVALIANLYNNNTQAMYKGLLDRTVLDTPVTIPAGQSKQITYTIRFNYGDAV